MFVINTLLTALAFLVFFIGLLPLMLILLIFQKKHPVGVGRIAQPFVKIGFRIVMFLTGSRSYIIGKENIPKDRPCMFATNHRGMLDAALAYMSLPVETGFVAKKELKKVPIFSTWMKLVNCFFLDREDPKSGARMLLNSISLINNGVSVFIAPEGTRSKTGEMAPFKEGSFLMAAKTGCPVVPVAMTGADDVFEKNMPFVKGAVTVIQYGEPIYPEKYSREELKNLSVITQEKVAEMLAMHSSYMKKPKKNVAK